MVLFMDFVPNYWGKIRRVAELECEVERLRQRLVQAETIIEVQKKVSLLLGIDPSPLANAGRP